jgi:sec-independent protein translocase protein TatB
MFDINWSELVVIGVVALIVIGPKELPAVLRAIGQWTTKIRRMAGEFQSQFQEAMREAEMADLKKQVNELGDAAKGVTDFDPLDFSEATKWEPKAEPKSDSKSEPKSDSKAESASPAASETTGAGPATASAETQHNAASEHASAPAPAPAEIPAPTPPSDAASTAEPQGAVPLAEGSGRA